jgi:phosphatidylserine decarboxylase
VKAEVDRVPTSIAEWRKTAMEKYKSLGTARLSHVEFLRDPCRAQRIDSRLIFAPADGIIIGQQIAKPDTDLIETKGTHCTLRELMQPWPIERPCFVLSIFLTFYDVHMVRCPVGGVLTYQRVGPIVTKNLPMLFEEHEICAKGRVSKDDLRYMARNAKVLCRFDSMKLAYRCYLILIGDSDVSAIMPFSDSKHASLDQCERCFVVRWGSQASLVLPVDQRYRFEPLCKVTDHVEAGIDALVKVSRREEKKA